MKPKNQKNTEHCGFTSGMLDVKSTANVESQSALKAALIERPVSEDRNLLMRMRFQNIHSTVQNIAAAIHPCSAARNK
jgi:hypothetical protein